MKKLQVFLTATLALLILVGIGRVLNVVPFLNDHFRVILLGIALITFIEAVAAIVVAEHEAYLPWKEDCNNAA